MAVTNLPILAPIYLACNHRDYWTAIAVGFVFVASFVSHLVENHKHGMPGFIKVSEQVSYYWNRVDVAGCALVAARVLYLYARHRPPITRKDVLLMGFSLAMNVVSEYDKYNPSLKWFPYIALHSIWHVMDGYLLFAFLQRLYYVMDGYLLFALLQTIY